MLFFLKKNLDFLSKKNAFVERNVSAYVTVAKIIIEWLGKS